MSWLNHYLDYAPVKEGMEGMSGESGGTGDVGVETSGIIREGIDGEEVEPYGTLFTDVKMLLIYYLIFLVGLFLGMPVILYYIFLAGSGYFPGEYQKPSDGNDENEETEPKQSEYLKIDEDVPYQVYLNNDAFKNPAILGIKDVLYNPTKEYDGEYFPNYQQWYERYFHKVLSITIRNYSCFMNGLSYFGLDKWIYLLILWFGSIFLSSTFNKELNNNYNFGILSKIIAAPFYILFSALYLSAFTATFYSFTALIKRYDPSINPPDPPYKLLPSDDAWGFNWGSLYNICYIIFCWSLLISLGLVCGLAFSVIITIYVIFMYLKYIIVGTGCYILTDKAERLNLPGFYRLLSNYCLTSAPWIVEFLLLVFAGIALSIDTNTGSKIYFGAWVSGFTLLMYCVLIRPWKKFKGIWREHFLEHSKSIEKKIGLEKEENKTECEKLDEKLDEMNVDLDDINLSDIKLDQDETKET